MDRHTIFETIALHRALNNLKGRKPMMVSRITLLLDKEHEFEEGEVITLAVNNVSFQPFVTPKDDVYIIRCSVLGPPVPVEGEIAELAKVNKQLTEFVKSIAEMGQLKGEGCPLCGSFQGHSEDCLYAAAHQLIGELAFEAVLGKDFKRKLGSV